MPEHGRTGTLEVGAARLRAAVARRTAGAAAVGALGAWYTLQQRTPFSPLDFSIQDRRGEGVIRVTGVLPHPRDALMFQDATGRELYRTVAPAGASPAMLDICRPDGSVAATVHNAVLSPVRDRWRIDVPGQEGMVAVGSVLHHEYVLRSGGDTIAVASKNRVPRRDTYGVMVDDGADLPLVLTVAVVLDLMMHRTCTLRPGDFAPGVL
jgi:uncharacterized protein YxjI